MTHLPLRLRIFLFFCLIALGGSAMIAAGLVVGARRGETGYVTAGLIAGFGLIGLVAGVWLLFDEHVAKPVERLAASLRTGGQAGVSGRYLGDLAPAATAMVETLSRTDDRIAQATETLNREKAQLLRILSDLPVAVMLMNPHHQIVLYDGQAADLMAAEGQPRLNAPVFDYLEEDGLRAALTSLREEGVPRRPVTLTGRSGAIYTGHLRRFGDGSEGYTLVLEPLAPDAARPVAYDFSLLDVAPTPALDAAPLSSLTFVVFDSETTGLDPQRDAVVQIGAVRVVNGRRVEGEVFDTLVNPGRPIPPGATRVHHVDDAMVADAPDITAAGRAFHRFASGAVLVAHNAPFDLAFLRRGASDMGVAWDHPVLDTVLLSAIVFGGSETHTLDALCARLGIAIPPEHRHTAMGDALATAEALVRLLPVLEARGIATFGQALAEARRHGRLLNDANEG